MKLLVSFLSLVIFASGCANSNRVLLDPQARASLSSVQLASLSDGKSVKTETAPQIRAEVLKAIKNFMTRVGRYPQRSVEDAAIVILQPLDSSRAGEAAGFSYRAVVRVDRAFAASQLVEFEVFERGGKVVVKKISL